MANTFFNFKQFTIHQNLCAMKVCTDACLFGAWLANHFKNTNYTQLLDVGTGTGLLTLMLAQNNINFSFTGVELDAAAYTQATQNIQQAPFKNNITLINSNILQYNPKKQFDVVFSNPPFFENSLPSQQKNEVVAKHSSTLTLAQLFLQAKKLVQPNGSFAILLPYYRHTEVLNIAQAHNLFLHQCCLVSQTTAHNYFRGMYIFTKTKSVPQTTAIAIKDVANNYTPEFTSLLQPYYLQL
jgi:tRNA1Val (adenine37-N6)-methyltransferase